MQVIFNDSSGILRGCSDDFVKFTRVELRIYLFYLLCFVDTVEFAVSCTCIFGPTVVGLLCASF